MATATPSSAGVDSRARWDASVVLADGETVLVRALRPSDAPALDAFHRRQSPESNYRRFFSAKPVLTPAELRHFTDVDMVGRAALCVEWHGEFIAWASYERWPGRDDADTAFMVDEAHQGKGIATLLLEHLAAIATSNGIERFTAEVLAENRAMLSVFARAGWPLQRTLRERGHRGRLPDRLDPRVPRLARRARAPRRQPSDGAAAPPALDRRRRGIGPPRHGRFRAVAQHHPRPPTCRCTRSTRTARRSAASIVMAWRGPTRSGRPSPRSPTTCGWRSSPCPPPPLDATLDDCIAAHVRGAVIVTAVDGEDSPAVDVDGLVARARRHGVRIIGPSSMGVATSHREIGLEAALVPVELSPGQHRHRRCSRARSAPRSCGSPSASTWACRGSCRSATSSDVSGNDLLQFWDDDDSTNVIAMYNETLGNTHRFARIARRVSLRRPIVAVRTGAAAIAPSGGALYQHSGLIEVPSVTAMLDTARVLATQPLLRGPTRRGRVQLAKPRHARRGCARRRPVCRWPRRRSPSTGPPRSEDYRTAIAAAIASDDVDGVLVIHAPPIHDAVGAPVDAIDEACRKAAPSRWWPCCSDRSTGRSGAARGCRRSRSPSPPRRCSGAPTRTPDGSTARLRPPPAAHHDVDVDGVNVVLSAAAIARPRSTRRRADRVRARCVRHRRAAHPAGRRRRRRAGGRRGRLPGGREGVAPSRRPLAPGRRRPRPRRPRFGRRSGRGDARGCSARMPSASWCSR